MQFCCHPRVVDMTVEYTDNVAHNLRQSETALTQHHLITTSLTGKNQNLMLSSVVNPSLKPSSKLLILLCSSFLVKPSVIFAHHPFI